MDISVCIGSSCHLNGARDVINKLKYLLEKNGLDNSVEIKGTFCMGNCACEGVSLNFNNVLYSIHPEDVDAFFSDVITSSLHDNSSSAPQTLSSAI